MKKINSVQDALAFLLEGLYYSEVKLKDEFRGCCAKLSSPHLILEINHYTSTCETNLLKLERIFNYLMQEPVLRKNGVVDQLMEATHQTLLSVKNIHLRDILTLACIQNINAFKISSYRSAYMLAVELEVDTVTDLIQQMLEYEVAQQTIIAQLYIKEFNTYQKAGTANP